MLGPSNYISFLTVVGFFIGTSFGIVKADDAGMLLFWPLAITVVFYILSVGVASYFIGSSEVKKNVYLNTEAFETKYDTLAHAIAIREKELQETLEFRREIEREDAEEAHKKIKKAVGNK